MFVSEIQPILPTAKLPYEFIPEVDPLLILSLYHNMTPFDAHGKIPYGRGENAETIIFPFITMFSVQ